MIFLSILVIAFGWTLIILSQLFEFKVRTTLEGWGLPKNSQLSLWAPAVIFGLINYICPFLIQILTDYEEWDLAEMKLESNLIKTFVC